jgi:competence protein ComEC
MSRTLRDTTILAVAAVLTSPLACQERQTSGLGTFRMTVFELKLHGLAIALETPSGALYFVDTGKKEDDYDAGRDTLAPFVKTRGVAEIAGIVVSHPHHDHYEGASYLLKNFRVKSFVDAGVDGPLVGQGYRKLLAHARERAGEVRTIHAGDTLQWDPALEVTVLAPSKEGVKSEDKSYLNNNSIVLRIRHGRNVFLLPGDLESEGRDALMAAVPPETLKATVLVGPHHGFAEGHRFAAIVKPEIVVVSCLDSYTDKKLASPGKHATELFGAVGAKVLVTAWHGTVELVSDGSTVSVKSERQGK